MMSKKAYIGAVSSGCSLTSTAVILKAATANNDNGITVIPPIHSTLGIDDIGGEVHLKTKKIRK